MQVTPVLCFTVNQCGHKDGGLTGDNASNMDAAAENLQILKCRVFNFCHQEALNQNKTKHEPAQRGQRKVQSSEISSSLQI